MIRFLPILILLISAYFPVFANEPDSVYLFAYAKTKDNGRSGLHFAWSADKKAWTTVGNEFGFVKSDYGRWGSQKQMNSPYLLQGPDGQWHCAWNLNESTNQLAHAASTDLVTWGRQSYPFLTETTTFQRPVIRYDAGNRQYQVTYASGSKFLQITTPDFKTFSTAKEVPAATYQDDRVTIDLPNGTATGTLHRVPWKVADGLAKKAEIKNARSSLASESVNDDETRFAGLKPVTAKITVQPQQQKTISDLLVGVFFEDINYAADGGLYAELVQNRDFEYDPADKEGNDKKWNSTHSWSTKGDNITFKIDTAAPIHTNNPHYAVLQAQQLGGALVNEGYGGIALKKGSVYNFSLFAKTTSGKGKLLVKLVSKENAVLAQTTINPTAASWKKYNATLKANADATNARLEIHPLSAGSWMLDMVSLFPQATFKNRPNGLRADLAQTVAAIKPRFIRFPGGCVAHGDGLHNIYRWKNTIGPLEARKPQRNLWGYHQSAGIGYYEYFQYCEDIGAEPLPVLAAGVPCQNSAAVAGKGGGQQGGIPMDEMDEYVQDILDLVEWANGPVTSKWGKLRAAAGHPKPFNLKYIGIGNEDLITDLFEERFTMIYNAMQQKHPEVKVIGTVGPFFEGTDYEEGWKIASKMNVPIVDEHYYESPGWFINNQQFYDRYDRSKPKVYLGEYASWGNTLYNALAEAAYLTALERNGDVVHMTSYAPLLAKEGNTQWNPDLIYFNNTEVKPTVNYEVQKLYGQNSGTTYLPTAVTLSNNQEAVKKRISVSVVQDPASKDIIVKLVNLLPVAATTSVNLNGVALAATQADKWVLQGKPSEKGGKPVQSTCTVADKFEETLAPYSFTVIRMKGK